MTLIFWIAVAALLAAAIAGVDEYMAHRDRRRRLQRLRDRRRYLDSLEPKRWTS